MLTERSERLDGDRPVDRDGQSIAAFCLTTDPPLTRNQILIGRLMTALQVIRLAGPSGCLQLAVPGTINPVDIIPPVLHGRSDILPNSIRLRIRAKNNSAAPVRRWSGTVINGSRVP